MVNGSRRAHLKAVLIGVAFFVSTPHTHADTVRYGLITNQLASSLSIIDIDTDKVITHLQVGDKPAGIAHSPGAYRAFITSPDAQTVSVIDLKTLTVEKKH
jgi:YVTN family beta-propeller protein